jgi:hypothetical protein
MKSLFQWATTQHKVTKMLVTSFNKEDTQKNNWIVTIIEKTYMIVFACVFSLPNMQLLLHERVHLKNQLP